MKKVKLLALGLVFIMLLGIFTGCAHWKYHAKLYDAAGQWIQEEFQSENLLSFGGGTAYPAERVFIVTNQEECNEIFVPSAEELSVDFDTQMLIVYTFTDTNLRNNRIVGMDADNGVLKIAYKMEEYLVPVLDTCNPYQRWFVVKMDKLAVNSVVFEEKR